MPNPPKTRQEAMQVFKNEMEGIRWDTVEKARESNVQAIELADQKKEAKRAEKLKDAQESLQKLIRECRATDMSSYATWAGAMGSVLSLAWAIQAVASEQTGFLGLELPLKGLKAVGGKIADVVEKTTGLSIRPHPHWWSQFKNWASESFRITDPVEPAINYDLKVDEQGKIQRPDPNNITINGEPVTNNPEDNAYIEKVLYMGFQLWASDNGYTQDRQGAWKDQGGNVLTQDALNQGLTEYYKEALPKNWVAPNLKINMGSAPPTPVSSTPPASPTPPPTPTPGR